MVGLLCHTAEADELFDGPISRSFDRRPALEEEMFGSLVPACGEVLADIDLGRVGRVAEKIARGLEAAEKGVPYAVDQAFAVRFREAEEGGTVRLFAPDFSYGELPGRGWEFTLFDSVRFEVTRLASLPN